MIAVGMRVHRVPDRAAVGERAHEFEHPLRMREIEQCIDEKRLAVAKDQAGVGLLPGAIRSKKGIEIVAEVINTSGIPSRFMIVRAKGSVVGIEQSGSMCLHAFTRSESKL